MEVGARRLVGSAAIALWNKLLRSHQKFGSVSFTTYKFSSSRRLDETQGHPTPELVLLGSAIAPLHLQIEV